MKLLSLSSAVATVALTLLSAGCSSQSDDSSGGEDASVGDASVEINALINQVCERNVACGQDDTTVTQCVVLAELDLVGDPYICDLAQEEMCLKEAAALPCPDAGGVDDGLAVAACTPCIPPELPLPDASPSHAVDACAVVSCDAN